jgi:hypothetical protein
VPAALASLDVVEIGGQVVGTLQSVLVGGEGDGGDGGDDDDDDWPSCSSD